MLTITRRVRFCAAHRLYNPSFSDEKNERVFGVCNNPAGHGHNYVLDVTLTGEADPETGMILDLKRLKDILHEEIVDRLDHKHLNVDVPFLEGVVPTAEMIVSRIWDVLLGKLPEGTRLVEVKLYESENNVATRSAG